MIQLCPICKRELKEDHMISYQDYHCFPSLLGHHYAARIKDDQIIQIKIRLRAMNGSNLFLKVYFNQGYSEVWSKLNDTNRIKINHVFMPDFNNLVKLEKKMKTYLLFS